MSRRATILGAGAMGTAFALPVAEAGYEVHLWGTPLDDGIIAALRRGEPHPRTGATAPEGILLHGSDELDEALAGCDLLVLAVASVGVETILDRAARRLTRSPESLLVLSKGFVDGPTGRVELLTETSERILATHGRAAPVIGIGGPCKANEIAIGHETWAVFSGFDESVARSWADELSSPTYRAVATNDVVGVEVSAALKNLYAVGLGVADGLVGSSGQPLHDLRAAAFTLAVGELMTVVEAIGGRAETVLGLAGTGDLDVTGRSGRNRVFGERLGRGEAVAGALAAMGELGLTVEGSTVAPYVHRLLAERGAHRATGQLPLLDALVGILAGATAASDIRSTLVGALDVGLDRRAGVPRAGMGTLRPAASGDGARRPGESHSIDEALT